MRVAIQGYEASFHAQAARVMFGDSIDLVYCDTFAEVFSAVHDGTVDTGVVAIENSLYGSINETYDLLLKHDIYISAETYLHVSLSLLGVAGSSLSDITDVYSQAPALNEARGFLDKHLPSAERHEHTDTAKAATYVADSNDYHKAAIASAAAGSVYGLTTLAEDIETHHHNYTRFIALTNNEQHKPGDACKSSITFETGDTPGCLYAALGVFADHNINLTKLESRPIVGKAWHYMYYVDLEADFTDELQQELKQHATNLRLLGVYPNNTRLPT